MSIIRKILSFKTLIVLLVMVVFFGILYGGDIYHYSESPKFCNSCHVMNEMYNNYIHNGAHRNALCIDCHLPNDNVVAHFVWKGIDGTKDVVYFYGNLYNEPIEISRHGDEVVKENCLRCHQGIMSNVNIGDRKCIDCHRRHTHKHTGVF
jgi:cytochrome c nitrite reductase small subunit